MNCTQEQRLHTRVCFYDPVRANAIQHPKASWYLPAEDLSEGGLMLMAPDMFAVGLRLFLDIEPDKESEPIHCVGQVVWVARARNQEGYRLGIKLIQMSDLSRERLRELVVALAKAMPRNPPST
ncbi:MAG: PilZ domain-containing protein [Thiohalocapsa sp.]